MDDLVNFLRARLDEDEAAIRTWAACCVHIDACDETGGYPERFDERRVLAEVEAKRSLLAHIGMVVISPGREALPAEYVEQMAVFARTLVLPYADHPDYREEWRP